MEASCNSVNPCLRSETWGTRLSGGSDLGHPPTRCITNQVNGSIPPELGTDGADGMANAIYDHLLHSGNYHQVGRAEAQRLANLGKVVYGAFPEAGHGHIVTVSPNNSPYAFTKPGTRPATGPDDPMINDIGANIGRYPLSQQPSAAFRKGAIFFAHN